MSIVPARKAYRKIVRDSVPNHAESWSEGVRGAVLNSPVEALQGPARGGRRMDRTITCMWCWEPLEEGSMFRLRRNLGRPFLAHVSCERRRRPVQ